MDKPKIVPGGTVRLIARPGFSESAAPLVGFAVNPLPDDAEVGDCIEIRLLPGGAASWRVVEKVVLTDKLEPGNFNGKTFNELYSYGHVGALCWADLLPRGV